MISQDKGSSAQKLVTTLQLNLWMTMIMIDSQSVVVIKLIGCIIQGSKLKLKNVAINVDFFILEETYNAFSFRVDSLSVSSEMVDGFVFNAVKVGGWKGIK